MPQGNVHFLGPLIVHGSCFQCGLYYELFACPTHDIFCGNGNNSAISTTCHPVPDGRPTNSRESKSIRSKTWLPPRSIGTSQPEDLLCLLSDSEKSSLLPPPGIDSSVATGGGGPASEFTRRSQDWAFEPRLPTRSVGSRTGARSRRSGVTGLHPFGYEVGSYSVRSSRFQSPPHQTQHADLPHYAFLITSR